MIKQLSKKGVADHTGRMWSRPMKDKHYHYDYEEGEDDLT